MRPSAAFWNDVSGRSRGGTSGRDEQLEDKVDSLTRACGSDDALPGLSLAELDDRASEPERKPDLGECPVAPAHGDHRLTGCRHREVSRMADTRDDDVVGPRVGVRVRFSRKD